MRRATDQRHAQTSPLLIPADSQYHWQFAQGDDSVARVGHDPPQEPLTGYRTVAVEPGHSIGIF